MESLNLNTLASSLPTANLQNAEKDLLNNFKAAALSITTLYRSSRSTSKRAYNTGYAAACRDLLMMIQQGVSVGGIGHSESGSHDPEEGAMTIGKVMDWIEARLEAIKAREEEEEEDEEKERDRPRNDTTRKSNPEVVKPPTPAHAPTTPGPATHRKDKTAPSLPTPSPSSVVITRPPEPSSPSPPPPPTPTTAVRSVYPSNPPQRSKSRAAGSDSKHNSDRSLLPLPNGTLSASILPPSLAQFDFTSASLPMIPHSNGMFSALPSPTIDLSTGAKRRHALMMMLDSSSAPIPSPSTASITHIQGTVAARRRTRCSRGAQAQHLSTSQPAEAMDVEEDNGRERKRVARRVGQP